MTKQEATKLFGGTQRAMATALGVTESAVSQWPAVLSSRQADMVLGAAYRLGLIGAPIAHAATYSVANSAPREVA